MWKNLKSKEFALLYLESKSSYVVIFRHLDKLEADNRIDHHVEGGACSKKQHLERNESEDVIEEIVEFFSNRPLSPVENVQKNSHDVQFEFYAVDDQKAKMSCEKEILFIILMRLHNFDLHFEEIVHELKSATKTEKQRFIKK